MNIKLAKVKLRAMKLRQLKLDDEDAMETAKEIDDIIRVLEYAEYLGGKSEI